MKWGIKCIAPRDGMLTSTSIKHTSRGHEAWCMRNAKDTVHADLNTAYHDMVSFWAHDLGCVYVVEEYPS